MNTTDEKKLFNETKKTLVSKIIKLQQELATVKEENEITKVNCQTYQHQLEALELSKNEQLSQLEKENGDLRDQIKKLEKEKKEMQNLSKKIPHATSNIEDSVQHDTESTLNSESMSEDESDITLENFDVTKYPVTKPFQIPMRVKKLIEDKVNEIISEDWTIDTIKNSHYTLYRSVGELMSSVFTNDYLKTHKRSGKGSKPGAVQRKIMNPTYVEEIIKYLIQAWKNLNGATPKLLRQMFIKYMGQFLNNKGRQLNK